MFLLVVAALALQVEARNPQAALDGDALLFSFDLAARGAPAGVKSIEYTVFVENEVDAWPNATIAFAAKEAASKLLRVGFALPLLGFRCAPDRIDVFSDVEGVTRGEHGVRFRSRRLGDRIVVVVRPRR